MKPWHLSPILITPSSVEKKTSHACSITLRVSLQATAAADVDEVIVHLPWPSIDAKAQTWSFQPECQRGHILKNIKHSSLLEDTGPINLEITVRQYLIRLAGQ